MPAINFQSQLAPKILSGSKPFTLRAPRKDGRNPKAGQTLYLFVAMRTKLCRKIAEKPCRFSAAITVGWRQIVIPTIGTIQSDSDLRTFSILDGFQDYNEFCRFHELALGMAPKTMHLIAWVTRDELAELLEKYPFK